MLLEVGIVCALGGGVAVPEERVLGRMKALCWCGNVLILDLGAGCTKV